ncbi:MAG: DNA primase [Flavobacteriales bacterium]|nr:DNA primase [Flavobacteriales bacterium]MBL6872630.1 DNA primase [Flavobacteriales bacterium]
MIPKETIDTIYDSVRIEEVVGDFVTLKKRGVNLLGNCPFHDEKTPSFTVSPVKGIFKCFGCGKGGNSINFVMEHEQYSYPEALRYLAKKYNIELVEEEQTPEQIEKANARESLFVVNSYARDYFKDSLHKSNEGKAIGLSYFKERGVSSEMIDKFQLGYNPEGWDSFTKSALGNSYKIEYLEKTGLSIVKDKKSFDRFRGRIMFPIHSMSGRVLGFGGRILKNSEKAAKYLNSPESDIYHKSKVLYGIYFSKSAIVKQDNCFLVEGYTDVISMHQHGIENVVASSGTALTSEQIKLIERFTKNITILFDGDSAGIKASFRGIDLILSEGMNVKVVLFPEGEDPDSYAKILGQEKIQSFITDEAQDFLTFKTNLLKDESKNDPIKKVNLINEIVNSIAMIPDEITRAVYIRECSKLLEIGETEISNKIIDIKRSGRQNQKTPRAEKKPTQENNVNTVKQSKSTSEYQEKDIIRFLLEYSDQLVEFDSNEMYVAQFIVSELENEIEFSNPNYQLIFDAYCQALAKEELLKQEFFTLHKNPNVSRLAADIISSPHSMSTRWKDHGIYTETEEMQLKPAVETAIYSLKIAKIGELIQNKNEELKAATEDAEFEILSEINSLSKLKKEISAKLGRTILK